MAEPLTAETILDAAEDVLRRFGPAKATVVDVARALDVSHGSVYRHFPSKAALRDAVTERWLARVVGAAGSCPRYGGPCRGTPAPLARAPRGHQAGHGAGDPELFATFRQLTAEAREVVAAHVDHLAAALTEIVADGVRGGEFAVPVRRRPAVPSCTPRRGSTTRRTLRNGRTRPSGPSCARSGGCSCGVWPPARSRRIRRRRAGGPSLTRHRANDTAA